MSAETITACREMKTGREIGMAVKEPIKGIATQGRTLQTAAMKETVVLTVPFVKGNRGQLILTGMRPFLNVREPGGCRERSFQEMKMGRPALNVIILQGNQIALEIISKGQTEIAGVTVRQNKG